VPALQPIDAHAHVLTDIAERDLRALRALVFAVTREPDEWRAAANRRDRGCVWGLGAHPGVPSALRSFDAGALEPLLARTPLIGEVGLDRRSKAPRDLQLDVFRQVLDLATKTPRLVTIHSVGMSGEVLAELRQRPIPGAILHWWRGDARQTAEAVELGCYFSLNGAEARNPKVLSLLPAQQVLTETDFPHSRRSDRTADKPGAVQTIEEALAATWDGTVTEVRERLWQNLARLCAATRTTSLMPRDVQATLLAL
jgi:TatD DNase family protein